MSKKVTIAVIIPCYNSLNTIENCIYSVLNQSEKVDELIVIDDGSTDESRSLIKRLFNSSSDGIRKVLLEQHNQGPSAARNNGVKVSTSTYIAFLDSEDRWFPNKIKIQKQFLENNIVYDIIATNYQSAIFKYSGEITFKRLLARNYFLTPCVVLKKEIYQACNGFNEEMRFAEDYFLWLNILIKGKGYLLPYIGAGNIENKRPFGDKGLSSNLKRMHEGVMKCYQHLLKNKNISYTEYSFISILERIKYFRRKLLSKWH